MTKNLCVVGPSDEIGVARLFAVASNITKKEKKLLFIFRVDMFRVRAEIDAKHAPKCRGVMEKRPALKIDPRLFFGGYAGQLADARRVEELNTFHREPTEQQNHAPCAITMLQS